MPLISVVNNGIVMVRRRSNDPDSAREFFATNGGVIDIADNVLKVLVDEADNGDEINEAEAQKAFERAMKLKSEAKDQTSLENAQAMVDRQAVRLRVAELKRHGKRT